MKVQVDRCLRDPREHPRVADLAPAGGSLEDKFNLNRMGDGAGGSVIFVRMSRVNHACDPNAEQSHCQGVVVSGHAF